MQSTNLGAAKVTPALAAPGNYVEMTFTAEAGRAYHLWVRGKAEGNNWANDSVHVQFDQAVNASGAAIYRIGTTGSAEVNLEDCSGCGLSGWGWQDNGYGSGVPGSAAVLRDGRAAADQDPDARGRGRHRSDRAVERPVRLGRARRHEERRHDSRQKHTGRACGRCARRSGALRGRPACGGGVLDPDHRPDRRRRRAAAEPERRRSEGDGSLGHPADFFEMTFQADAGRPYRLWIRAKAASNHWANDSVHVQFSDTVTARGAPQFRIGSPSAAEVNLEDCSSCGVAGWGWQDNGYGAATLGPELRFATSGTHTIRVQVREDGLGIDQIVLSAARFLTSSPGSLKNDSTILARTGQ